MGRVTIPARWPSSAALSDYASNCDICGVPWRRSQLHHDTRGYLVCPNHGSGRDPAELSMLNAESAAAWAEELASRPPRDEPMERDSGALEPEASAFIDINDPSLPTWTAPTRALVNRWRASSGVTVSAAGAVTAWVDSVGGQTLTPTGPGTTDFRYVASHAAFRWRPVVQNNMTSAVSRATVGSPASAWRFLHDGSGMTVVWIALITAGLVGLNTSGGTGATALGMQLARSGESPRSRSGTGAGAVYDTLVSNIPSVNAVSLWMCEHKSSMSPQATIRRGSTVLRGVAESNPPSSSNPTNALEMRCDVTSEVSTAEILIYNDVLSADELAELATYAALTYAAIVS